ncbi:TetR/AcrR family transcriptional regulator [Leucobacter coleopterorum]|uniref:TetR/AcrR family transcriptional regulator n=1 Tax=Leucobacter coleopterorum TaxID=2714933 RepID=A0ABX6JZZ1_9MICO|nr:TetR/AcrR family transcriptional regulator [Leucobacter coleopterorum]QIM19486.1 TetR/AcrR family transcriptional regulator [Leucobacter coleopterorum]
MSSSTDAYHHGSLAAALEDAAMQLLERMPASEISLREVARAANVSHNAPYHHFSDRRGLLKVLAERSMADLVAQVREGVATAGSIRDAMRAGSSAYISFAVNRPYAFQVIYDPTVCIPGAPSEQMAPLIQELEHILASIALQAGFDSPTDVQALWGLVHGLGTLSAAGHFSLNDALTAADAMLERALPGEG